MENNQQNFQPEQQDNQQAISPDFQTNPQNYQPANQPDHQPQGNAYNQANQPPMNQANHHQQNQHYYQQGGFQGYQQPPYSSAPRARRNQLLFTVSILLIVFGIIGAVQSLGGLFSSFFHGGLYAVLTLISCLASALRVVAGIVGLQNADKPYNADKCKTMGIVTLIGYGLSQIFYFIWAIRSFSNILSFIAFFSLLLGAILPILYLVGVDQLKKGKL
jgi:hypothetical protein